ncbi:MAG: hypothetical protein ACFFDT_25965 [Candidatus Hodarchaeota archaeon]
MDLQKEVHFWLKRALDEPIVKILLKNSNLTKIQLETLLIDVLADNYSGKSLKYSEKASLRLIKSKISRGSFQRTLVQAKQNAIKGVYTILLLGYLGIFEGTSLDPYLEVANKLNTYIEAYTEVQNTKTETQESLKIIEMLKKELETSLNLLSK